MLFIIFQLGKERYALEATHVIEVIPRLSLRPLPSAPDYVAGLFNFRGSVVPVLDLGTLALGVPCPMQLNTRIILVQYSLKSGVKRILGFIAEAVTDAVKKEPSEFIASEMTAGQAPYLGKISLDDGGMVQCVLPEHLLPHEVEKLLFEEGQKNGSTK